MTLAYSSEGISNDVHDVHHDDDTQVVSGAAPIRQVYRHVSLGAILSSTPMQPLSAFTLPLDPRAPPSGYTYPEHALSDFSTTTAFNAGLDERDIFLGECRCIICGDQGRVVQYCHIIPETESHMVSQELNVFVLQE